MQSEILIELETTVTQLEHRTFQFNGLVCLFDLLVEKVVEAVAWVFFFQPGILRMLVRPQSHIILGKKESFSCP